MLVRYLPRGHSSWTHVCFITPLAAKLGKYGMLPAVECTPLRRAETPEKRANSKASRLLGRLTNT